MLRLFPLSRSLPVISEAIHLFTRWSVLRFLKPQESTAFGEARFVIPAKAGIQRDAMRRRKACSWRE
jgi:hypothetical protein